MHQSKKSRNDITQFSFLAHKLHVHHWPPDTPPWSLDQKQKVKQNINPDVLPIPILIQDKIVKFGIYQFEDIKKVGITIPLFKKQCTVIFEGHHQELYAHVHITTKSDDYLYTFNNLMNWRKNQFPDAFYIE